MNLRLSWESPWWLLALVLVPYAYWRWRRYVLLPGIARQQRWVPLLRALALFCLILAAAGTTVWAPRPGVELHVLVDTSASVLPEGRERAFGVVRSLAELLGPHDRIMLYAFGGDVVSLGEIERGGGVPGAVAADPGATDIAAALTVALGRAAPGANARILLISDGVETRGNAGALAALAASRGTPIDVVPLPREYGAEVEVEDLALPASVAPGEPYSARAVVRSTVPTRATLRLYRNGSLIAARDVELAPGRTAVTFDGLREDAAAGEAVAYELWLDAVDDGFSENNSGYALVRVETEAQVLVVSGDPDAGRAFGELLKARGITADVRGGGSFPSGPMLANYRAVVLIDLPASQLSPAHREALVHFVEHLGGGLLAIGGPNSFGLGGYARTELEALLPVSMDAPQSLIMPSLALVLALDRSGSMAETQGSYSKLDLAKEAALSVLELMNERDLIGVLAFDSYPFWVVPVQPVQNRVAIASAVASLSAEGGTNLGPALESAHRSLVQVDAALKHLIVLSDGRSTPADFQALTLALRNSGVTVTAVGVGRDADLELLADIARWGGGRYYFTEDIRAIPQIFVTEATLISRPLRVDEPFIPQWHQQADFWHDRTPVPPLGGYVVTSPKAAAAVHLKAPDESPILATWRRGLGKAAAFTASAGEPWIGAWRDWEGYGALMSQLVRWLMRSDPPAGLLPQIAIEGGRGILTVDALDPEGGFQNFLELAAEVLAPGGERLTLALDQVAPGRYEAEFPAGRPGPYLASIRSAGGDLPSAAWTGAASPYPEEYRVLRPDSGLLLRLAEATGGAVLSDPGPASLRALLTHPAPSVRAVPLAPYLLAAALILAFLDIAVRYVPLSAIAGLLGTLRPRRLGAAGAVTDEQALRRMMAQDAEGWEKAREGRDESGRSAGQTAQQAGRYLAARKKLPRGEEGGGRGAP